jgi:acetyl esterase/lipase
MIKKLLLSGFCSLSALISLAQQEIPLYNGPVPNAKESDVKEVKRPDQVATNVIQPTLSIYLPPKGKANGTAVIICPGGGYGALVMKREGYDVAEAFNKMGVTAFVLKYRLPSEKTMIDPSIGPLQDAQQAIKTVRQRATEWGVDPKKIGNTFQPEGDRQSGSSQPSAGFYDSDLPGDQLCGTIWSRRNA